MELYFFRPFFTMEMGTLFTMEVDHFLLWKSTIFYYGNGQKWGVKIR